MGRPCDFPAFRIHAAPGPDPFTSALVGRDEGGWYARSAICTHQGCSLASPTSMVEAGIACPCHGSLFDHHGIVVPNQPAKADLSALALALGCDGELYVDLNAVVDPTFRLVID